uniref:Uncharacterized protein n=1 Tax=Anguilla anguilla TaxID=7936 RepID=A0A0E9SPW2_ANGAN
MGWIIMSILLSVGALHPNSLVACQMTSFHSL